MPARQFIRALVTASFVTPRFSARSPGMLAAPNSGLLNQLYRFLTGAESDAHLFDIYSLTGIIFVISCYTFPFVSCWWPTRSTTCRANSRMLPPSSAARRGPPHAASRFP